MKGLDGKSKHKNLRHENVRQLKLVKPQRREVVYKMTLFEIWLELNTFVHQTHL